MLDAVSQFQDAIRSAGLTPPDTIVAGKLQRFASNGKRGDDAGWCKLFPDLAGGIYGDHRTGFYEVWQAKRERPYTPAEHEAFRQRCEQERREREAEDARRHAEAATIAAAIWKAGTDPAGNPYLARKGVKSASTLRELPADKLASLLGYVPKSKGEPLAGRVLIAPVKVGDKLSTAELIDEAGRKSAVYGGVKAGGYWAAQPLPDTVETLLIGEGVATALSAKEATGHPTIAALSSGNFEPVAKAMREKYPAARMVILGDLGNGQEKAEAAAREVNGLLALPQFAEGELIHGKPPTDMNDLAQLHKLEAVERAIASASLTAMPGREEASENPPADEYERTVELIRGCDVKPEPIAWLWDGWLAAGKMHVLGGAPGTGKTTISMALAATVTTGGLWPDGTRSPAGNVVIWSGEDDPADTLIPRLALSDADLSRIYFIGDFKEGNERRSFDPARDMEVLRRKLGEVGDVRLLIVDPIVSAVAGDSHKNAEVRRSLQPLADLAVSMRCALLGITHFSKGTGGRDPVERLTGSLAFGALARVVLVAAKHQEEGEDGRIVRIFLRAKSNIGPDDGGFEYDLHQGEAYPGIFNSSVLWGEAVEGAARELLATADATGEDGEGGTLADAKRFLADLLADGPLPAKTIKADADGAGYSWATIRRAQKTLGIEPSKTGMKGGWKWAIPRRCSETPEGAQQKELSTFGNIEHLRNGTSTVEVEI